jgi:hypothetical protein
MRGGIPADRRRAGYMCTQMGEHIGNCAVMIKRLGIWCVRR